MDKGEVHLRDYIAVIFRHYFLIAVSFLLIFGTALIVSLYLPRVYESTTIIEIQQSSAPTGLSGLMQNVISRGVDQVSMETICKRFVSNSILNETIHNLKRRSLKDNIDLSPEFLAPRIIARAVPDTKMIEVKVKLRMDEGGSERAAIIANELIRVMQSQRGSRNDAEAVRRQGFIDDKIKNVELQIDDSDKKIKSFLKNKGDTITWSAYSDYLLNRISSLTEMKETNGAMASAEQKKLGELKAKLANEPEFIEYSKTLSQDVLWNKYKTDLSEVNLKLAEAQSEFGLQSPKVKGLQAQIAEINEKMKDLAKETMYISSKTESRNPAYMSLVTQIIESELNLITYTSICDMSDKLLKQLNTERDHIFSQMPENQYQLDKMNREIDYKVDVYKDLLTKKIEAEIMANENINDGRKIKGGIEVIDLAQPTSKPISPRIKFIMLISCIVGLAVSLGMAFLSDYFKKA